MAYNYSQRDKYIRQLLEESTDDDYGEIPSSPKTKVSDSETEDVVEREDEEFSEADDTDTDKTYMPKESDFIEGEYSSESDCDKLTLKRKKSLKKKVSSEQTKKRKNLTTSTASKSPVFSLPSTSRSTKDFYPNTETLPNLATNPNLDALPNQDAHPNHEGLPNQDALPNHDGLPNKDALPNYDDLPNKDPLPNHDSLPNQDALPNHDSPLHHNTDAIPNEGPLPIQDYFTDDGSDDLVPDSDPDDPIPQADSEPSVVPNRDPHLFIPQSRFIRAPNKHLWSTRPPPSTRTPMRNIVLSKRDVVGNAKNSILPVSCFLEMIDEPMLNRIVQHTNEKMNTLRQNYQNPEASTVQPLDLQELKAFLGLLVNSAWCKDNHLAVRDMFDSDWSGSRYRCVMSSERFDFILLSLRFDDTETREERKASDPFAPIRELWEAFTFNCRSKYTPGSYVTVDEQLLGFRGKCPFRMYIPSKPTKYGIKLVLCCDTTTYYMVNGIPYVGKKTQTNGMPIADFFVKELTRNIHGTNRSVTTDNWFTSVSLSDELLKTPYNLTTVGTIRVCRKGVPKELGNKQEKPIGSSMFLFDKEKTLVSFKPKKNKVVVLLSTMHSGMSLNPITKKPEIIHTYNATKGAVDTLDKMCGDMSCSRKTQRWPLCVFFGMMNIAFVNSYVIYCMNNIRQGNTPLKRKEFMKQLCKELTEPQLRSRLEVPQLRRTTKLLIHEALGSQAAPPVPREHGARKICAFCPVKLRRMTTSYCVHCDKSMCGQCRAMCCRDCDSQ